MVLNAPNRCRKKTNDLPFSNLQLSTDNGCLEIPKNYQKISKENVDPQIQNYASPVQNISRQKITELRDQLIGVLAVQNSILRSEESEKLKVELEKKLRDEELKLKRLGSDQRRKQVARQHKREEMARI